MPRHIDVRLVQVAHRRHAEQLHRANHAGPKDFEGAEARQITQPRWAGKYLTGQEFAIQHMLPNFYFHVTTAYAILRHNGVDVGKKDYLGAMPYKEG